MGTHTSLSIWNSIQKSPKVAHGRGAHTHPRARNNLHEIIKIRRREHAFSRSSRMASGHGGAISLEDIESDEDPSLTEHDEKSNLASHPPAKLPIIPDSPGVEATAPDVASAASELKKGIQHLTCDGGSNYFQRRNFHGTWAQSEDLANCNGRPHYEHVAPNATVVHLFFLPSSKSDPTHGRWVLGLAPGVDDGWAFVETSCSRPQDIVEPWQILDDDDGEWKPSPRFRLVDPDPLSASRMKQLQKLRRERNKANAGEASSVCVMS